MDWQPIATIPKDRQVIVADQEYHDEPDGWSFEVVWWEPSVSAHISNSRGAHPDDQTYISREAKWWADIPLPPLQ